MGFKPYNIEANMSNTNLQNVSESRSGFIPIIILIVLLIAVAFLLSRCGYSPS